MARASPLIPAVNAGEFSPRMVARVDFDKYRNACALARNIIAYPTGGFTKCPGTKFITEVADSSKKSALIPFIFSEDDASMLEFFENGLRFIHYQSQVMVPDIDASISGGDFDVTGDISYWDDTGTGTLSYDEDDERLQLGAGNDTVYSATEQEIATNSTGTVHVIRFKIEGTVGASVHAVVGSSSDSDDLFEETELGIGWHTIAFIPTSSPFYFGIRTYTDEPIYLDDVELLDNEPLHLTHDYTEAQVQELRHLQTADVVYLFHPDKPVRKLQRRGLRTWSLVDVPWHDGPYSEPNPGTDLNDLNLIDDPNFETGIQEWDSIVEVSSREDGVEWDSSQFAVFLSAGDDSNEYSAIEKEITVDGDGTQEYVIHFQVIGENVTGVNDVELLIGTTSEGEDIHAATEHVQGYHSVAFSTNENTFFVGFRKLRTAGTDQSIVIGGLTFASLYRQNANLIELSGTEGEVTATGLGLHEPFSSTDVGRLIRLTWPGHEPAWGVITAFTDTQNVTVRLRRKAPYSSIPTEDWRLGSWSGTSGYPSNGSFFQNRLVIGDHAISPQTLWFSQTADLENFRQDSFVEGALDTQDDDALIYSISSKQIDAIQWISGARRLIIGTLGGQHLATSQGNAITASDIDIAQHTDIPSRATDPVETNNAVVLVEKSGRELQEISYSINEDGFLAADLTLLADHIFYHQNCEEIAYQRRPYSVIWGRRADGRLGCLSYNRHQDVVGWSQRQVAGTFGVGNAVVESIAVKPGNDDSSQDYASDERDEVWLVVKRTINGSTKRTIEVMEGYYFGPVREDYDSESDWETAVKEDMLDAFYVDGGITVDNPVDITNATQADPVVVTASSHGFSDGDEVRITDVGGMTEINNRKFLVADKATNSFSLVKTSGAVSITDATQANPVVITAADHGFADGDKIGIFDVSGMTEINGRVFTVANKTDDTFELSGEDGTGHTAYTSGGSVYHAEDGTGHTAYISGGEVRATFTTVTGLDHLEGETVVGIADGVKFTGKTVSSGQITLDNAASKVQVGLSYKWRFESLKLPFGTQSGSALNKTKTIARCGLVLHDSGPYTIKGVSYGNYDGTGFGGRREHDGYTFDFNRDGLISGDPIPLYTGETQHSIDVSPSLDVRIYLEGDAPLPFTCLAVAPQVESKER